MLQLINCLKPLYIFVASYYIFILLYLHLIIGGFTKYDSKLDFDCKSISKLESNAKVTQKPCEITASPL